MKFGKEFTSQMVPEWQEAYMDYNFLKNLLKEIKHWRLRIKPSAIPPGMKRRLTMYRAFSGLTQRNSPSPRKLAALDIENQDIVVNPESNETMFLRTDDEGGEYELVYFRRLDDEFKKVVNFYKSKVGEVVNEAQILNKQMDALIAFRIKVEKPQGWFHHSDRSAEMTRLASDVAASAAALSASTPSVVRSNTRVRMGVIDESRDDDNENGQEPTNSKVEEHKPNDIKAIRPAPLEILNHVKMNNTRETPVSTIKGFLNVPDHTELEFSRENLRKVEEQLKRAFVEFYNKLRLLKSFSFLNLLAFSKIMKKYDKVTSRSASRAYLKMVDDSFLGSSDEVSKLTARVEATFIKHFSNSNRGKGMGVLRPKAKRERHRTTFSLGFLAGCTAALILALVLIIRVRKNVPREVKNQYMDNMFPLYSLFGFVVLHMVMYAVNIYFWRRYRVNYSFIFGFKKETEFGFRQVFLLGFGLAVLALASVLSNLDMEIDPKTHDYKALTELIPLGVVVLVIVILICPFNIIYRSSRFFFLTCVFHCICAPLYKVTLPDFFLADQLTSQVQAIRSLQFYICYYGWGDYKHRRNTCSKSTVYTTFLFIVAVIPYWSRLLQVLNVLLRFAWLQTVLKFKFSFLHAQTLLAIVACLEIIRRGIWNFFRLENEHLNNVGKFRAFKSVPFPFNYDEDENKDL